MGERKVMNMYYPPDFDPAKIPRRRQPKNKQIKVRMMLPMSIRCKACGTYIYKGTKFNSRKEDVIGEAYLGIQIFRFYFKCNTCSVEFTLKTDPRNSDYVVELGAARNSEPWRDEEDAGDKEKRRIGEEEMENRAMDSKQHMDILAALEENKSMNSRRAAVSVDKVLEKRKQSAYEKEQRVEEEMDKEDEEVVKSVLFRGSKDYVRRIQDDEDLDEDLRENPTTASRKANIFESSKKGESPGASLVPRMPKFIFKLRSTTNNLSKKPRTESVGKDLSKNGEIKDNIWHSAFSSSSARDLAFPSASARARDQVPSSDSSTNHWRGGDTTGHLPLFTRSGLPLFSSARDQVPSSDSSTNHPLPTGHLLRPSSPPTGQHQQMIFLLWMKAP